MLALRSLIVEMRDKKSERSRVNAEIPASERIKKPGTLYEIAGLDVSDSDYQRVIAALDRYYDLPTATDNGAKTIINSDMWMSDDDKDRLIGALGL